MVRNVFVVVVVVVTGIVIVVADKEETVADFTLHGVSYEETIA